MLSFCLNAYNRVDRFNHSITILGIFCFTLIFIFTLYLLYHEYQIEQCNKKIIEENNYIKSIAKKDEEFKHNLINNLLGIKTVSNSKTNKLIDELISDYQKDYKNITNINDLPNGVQSIIYRKAYEDVIEGLNLIVTNNIKNELYDLISPKKYNNLCTAIGILFDNALEAVKNTPEKIIEINFCEDVQKIYFVIKNTFSNVMDLEETGKKNFTTKKTGHGIGLNYLKNLKTLELENKIINDIFIIKLSIKKNKKI
jgi:two-component system sensor histidine kinase AgrC